MRNKIIANALAALCSLNVVSATAADHETVMGNIPGMEKCYGVAKKGLNDCGTALHHCAGEAKMDADKKEWILVPSGLCQKIVGGSLTRVADKSDSGGKPTPEDA